MRSFLALLAGCCLAVCLMLTCPSVSSARGWRQRFAANPTRPTPAQNPYAAKRLYPQYDAGFHARHLQNIGIPSGDVGLRGNGITQNPW